MRAPDSVKPVRIVGVVLVCLAACGTTSPAPAPQAPPPGPGGTDSTEQVSPQLGEASRGATRDGRSIASVDEPRLTFEVPQAWIQWYEGNGDQHRNFHLTPAELSEVRDGEGEWDTEFAKVVNAVLPFERCVAHVGGEGWGRGAVAYNDLQVRAYLVGESAEAVEQSVRAAGAAQVRALTGTEATIEADASGPWRRISLGYFRMYQDYGAGAIVDFRLRRFGIVTAVFAFMYTDHPVVHRPHAEVIAEILGSVRVGNAGAPAGDPAPGGDNPPPAGPCDADAQHCCLPDGRVVRPGGCQPMYPDGVHGGVVRGPDGRCQPIECHLRCLPAQALIATPGGEVQVSRLRVGDRVWTMGPGGERVAAPVRRIEAVPLSGPHTLVEIELADGRVVRASAGHPTADGRELGNVLRRQELDGAQIVSIRSIPYDGGATWDLLPAGPTGVYWADGVLLGSTLLPVEP